MIRICHRGSILISLIVTMVIMSALGAAMLSLFSTSTMSRIMGNNSVRAYYLAESGFRYADSELANTGKNMRDNKLESLHDTDYALAGDDGEFHLDIYPYYYVTTAYHPFGSETLNTKVCGGIPTGLGLTSGSLKIDDTVYDYTNAILSDPNVTFTISGGVTAAISDDAAVMSVSRPAGSQSLDNITNNYIDLETSTGSANAFPEINGTFRIDGSSRPNRLWSYKELSETRLKGITPVDDPGGTFSVALDSTNHIILEKFVELHSTGIIDPGNVLETKRELIYNVPLNVFYKVAFNDTFEDLSHWSELAGSHVIKTIGGDSALKVTGTDSQPGAPKVSLIALDWASTAVNLETVHLFAGNYLSYDSQVNIGFEETTPAPDWGYDPAPVPKYFVAGISFRLDSDENYYGLSFLRGSNSMWPRPDNINNNIVPVDQKLSIVLWQKTGPNESDLAWLAYKDLSQNDFFDDVESGENGWTASGLWHISEHRSESSSHSWYYGREGTWNYNTGATNSGYIETPAISLCGFSNATLKFWSWYHTEDNWLSGYFERINAKDLKYVEILDEGGNTLKSYQIIDPAYVAPATPADKLPQVMSSWDELEIILDDYVGQVIKVRFEFNTWDNIFNNYEGWYIDDIKITGDYEFPVNEATLMVRLKEGASVSFTSGGTTAIEEGDIVTQSDGAEGTVIGTPILSSGTWSGGDAAGVIILNNLPRDADGSITHPFAAGALLVEGSDLATVTGSPRPRDNYIRAYYSDTSGSGTANDVPTDDERHAYPRSDDIRWPPDDVADWSTDNDYFTLVQWDAINLSEVSKDIDVLGKARWFDETSVDEPKAIFRSSETKLLTQDTGGFSDSELGLHAMGKGATNVYFDDFAIQAEIRAKRTGFLPSVQQ